MTMVLNTSCYGGRGLRKSEINWTISELECLAIIEGTRCYHTYLAGRPFTIVTDHVSLTYLNSLKAGRGRLQRSALHLQGYTFQVQYKPGKRLTSADGLSRRDYPTPPAETDNDALDDDSFLSTIDTDLFNCVTNDKHRSRMRKQLYSINFVYDNDSPHASDTPDTDIQTTTQNHISAVTDNLDIPAEQRQCPDFQDMIAY